jgi:hypothetical protein
MTPQWSTAALSISPIFHWRTKPPHDEPPPCPLHMPFRNAVVLLIVAFVLVVVLVLVVLVLLFRSFDCCFRVQGFFFHSRGDNSTRRGYRRSRHPRCHCRPSPPSQLFCSHCPFFRHLHQNHLLNNEVKLWLKGSTANEDDIPRMMRNFGPGTVCKIIHNTMLDLKTNKNRAILRQTTDLSPTIGN